MMGLHHKLGDPPTEPLSLQRQIDSLETKMDHLNMQIQSLMNRTSDLEEIRDRSKRAAKKADHLMVETDMQNRRFDALEKKIDACRVAVHNVDRITHEHTLRLHGLDEIVKDYAIDQLLLDALEKRVSKLDRPFEGLEIEYGTTKPDPWKERWDALKARFAPTRADELEERLTYRYLQRVMDEMEEA